jgi:hypothetical protein
MEPEGSLPVYKSPPSVTILSQIDPVQAPTSHFLNNHPHIILPFTPESSKWSLSPRFSHQNPVYTTLCPIRATCHAPLVLRNVIARIVFGERYRSLNFSLFSFLHYPLTWSLLGQDILLSAIFSNTLSLRSSLNVSDQVAHPYKTTGKIS